ncbi:hypothetical protein M9458_035182, partial [Cirrhinus mrigala]
DLLNHIISVLQDHSSSDPSAPPPPGQLPALGAGERNCAPSQEVGQQPLDRGGRQDWAATRPCPPTFNSTALVTMTAVSPLPPPSRPVPSRPAVLP